MWDRDRVPSNHAKWFVVRCVVLFLVCLEEMCTVCSVLKDNNNTSAQKYISKPTDSLLYSGTGDSSN